MLEINDQLSIPLAELTFTYARSAGPGGQNVNKVNTKVTLHWTISECESLPDDVRRRFMAKYGTRVNKQGELVIQSQRFRDQVRNIEDCRNKLRQMLLDVWEPPKRRKKTRPTRASRERRLSNKREKSEKKQGRKPFKEE